MKVTLMKELLCSHIHIKDESEVTKKLQTLIEDGASSLQVISDFDMTLSRYSFNKKKCPSSHGILEGNIHMTPEEREKHTAVVKKYYGIEIDPHMTVEEKIPYMLEWWSKAHEAMGNAVIRQSDIKEAVAQSNAALKDGCEDLFELLNEQSIPLLILSAGLGNVIEEVIRQKSHFYPNMKLVSNIMVFDEKGVMCGFEGETIHTFNKNEGALAHSSYFDEISHRHNIILVGDMMGDLEMANGVQNINTMLKIGYLNHPSPALLAKYKDAWDIVIVEDQTVDVLASIVKQIVNNTA